MTNRKNSKRALLMSALSLLLCVSMLVGTTFAWFTDSVTSAGNIIQSGRLDVEMNWVDGKENPATTTAWKDASEGAIFNYDLWEPGYAEVRHIEIKNAGTLALKYQLSIAANGEVSKLADAIDVYYVDPAQQINERTGLTADKKLGTLTEVLAAINTTASGELKAGESHTITLALKMREEAGNEYQGLSIGSEFAVQVMATQLTSEFDSFDNQYDVNATYLNKDADGAWLINNMDELYYFASQVNSGNTYKGETVKLTADIDLAGYNWIPIGQPGPRGTTDFSTSFRGTFDGQNHTVSNVKVSNEGWAGLFGLAYIANIQNVTVKNAELNSSRMAGAVVGQLYGNIENCHVEDATITAVPNMTANGYDNGDKIGGIVGWLGDNGNNHHIENCSAKNVTLKAYRDVGGIAGYIGSSTTVTGCAVDAVSITVDQATNHYGVKDANAGAVVGRIYKQPVTIENNTENAVEVFAPVFVATADQLQTALTNGVAQIALAKDISVAEKTFLQPADKSSVLFLNGKTISGTFDVTANANKNLFEIKGSLTVEGEGLVTMNTTGLNMGWNAMSCTLYVNGGDLTVNNATVKNTGGTDMAYAIDTNPWNTANDVLDVVLNKAEVGASYFGIRVRDNGPYLVKLVATDSNIDEIWYQEYSTNYGVLVEVTLNNTPCDITYVNPKGICVEVDTAEELKDALMAGNKAVLTGDIALETAVTINQVANIDLGGKTLSVSNFILAKGGTVNNGTIKSLCNTNMVPNFVVSGGHLEMNDVKVDTNHYLYADANWSEAVGMSVQNATAVLNNCDIRINNQKMANWVFAYAIDITNATLTVNGGTITAECVTGTAVNGPSNPIAISSNGNNIATLKNVVVNAPFYGSAVNGKLTINTTDRTVQPTAFANNNGGSYALNFID